MICKRCDEKIEKGKETLLDRELYCTVCFEIVHYKLKKKRMEEMRQCKKK